MNLFEITAYAANGNAQAAGPASMLMTFAPFLLIIVVMYFLMIRPQKKKEKLKQEMLSQLIRGDKILTIGGIHGKIVDIKGDELVIESGSKNDPSTIRISRWAVSEVTKPGNGSGEDSVETDSEE